MAAQDTAEKESQKLRVAHGKDEEEIRQLREVISQLRSVRRTAKGDINAIKSERDALQASAQEAASAAKLADSRVLEMEVRIESLERALSHAQKIVDEGEDMREQFGALQQQLLSAEEEKAREAKVAYDQGCTVDALKADSDLLKLELERKDLELKNLHNAIYRLEQEKGLSMRKAEGMLSRQLEEAKEAMKQAQRQSELDAKEREDNLRRELKLQQQACQDEALMRRKAELEMKKERDLMQQSVELAVNKMRNSNEDSVDRTLIANTLVMYFKRKRSTEILNVIAKMLSFSDQQFIDVGLKVAPNNFFTNLLNHIAPTPEEQERLAAEKAQEAGGGSGVAELWLDFLLNETETAVPNDLEGSKEPKGVVLS